MKLLMIADDFTGANDTGVQFSKKGLKTLVSLYNEDIEVRDEGIDVLVIDTESRFDDKKRAYEKVSNVVHKLQSGKGTIIYKKVDSTLRGNIGAEIEGAMDAAGVNLAVFTPAFPNNGRTVENGVLMLKGIPVDKTEVAKDPKNPVSCSYIPDILKDETSKQIAIIGFQEILQGSDYVASKIDKLADNGYEIIASDARTNEELDILAKATAKLNKEIMLAGSAGLAEFIPNNFFAGFGLEENTAKAPLSSEGSIVIMAGSVSDVLRRQVKVAAEEGDFQVIDLDMENVILHKWEDEKKRILSEVKKYSQKNQDIILRSAKGREEIELARSLGRRQGFSDFEVSEKIACFYGDIAKLLADEVKIRLLMLSGGDIAIKAAYALQVEGIKIEDEILPGIPFGYFARKNDSEIPVVTKAGSFGKEDAIIEVINYIKRR